MRYERKYFLNPRNFDRYNEYRTKLPPSLQKVFDDRVRPECDCDYGTSSCPHMGHGPAETYNAIVDIVNAYQRDDEDDYSPIVRL